MYNKSSLAKLNSWGITLSEPQINLLDIYAKNVFEKNRMLNLTAANSLREIWQRHITDSLAGLPVLKTITAGNLCPKITDAGSGCGYLGICIKIAWPETEVSLMESSRRKIKFLEWAVQTLGLKGIRPLGRRLGEKKPDENEKADIVIERAMGKLPDIFTDCMEFAKDSGFFAAYQSMPEMPTAGRASTGRLMESCLEKTVKYTLPGEHKERALLIFKKTVDGRRPILS